MLHKLHSGQVMMLLVTSSMLRNQQYVLTKLTLNRNTHEAKVCVDWLVKYCDQKRSGTQPCISPGAEADSVFTVLGRT